MGLIWLRADANAQLGAGHLVRMLELERQLAGRARLMVTHDLMAVCIAEQRLVIWRKPGEPTVPELREGDTIVFDLKNLPAAAVRAAQLAGARAVVIEDAGLAGEKADLLIDCNRFPEEANEPLKQWFGPHYPLLREAVVKLRRPPVRKTPHHIVIALGGGSTGSLVRELMRELRELRLRVTVIAGWGEGAPRDVPHGVDWLHAPAEAPAVLVSADIVVSAGGVTMWEGLCLGRTVVVLPRNAEQERNARRQEKMVAVARVGDVIGTIGIIRDFIKNPARAYDFARGGYDNVTGEGMRALKEYLFLVS